MTKYTLLSIITFFAIAFGLTFAFSKLPTISFYSVEIKDILCGFGPLISGLLCYQFLKTPTSYSIGGTQPSKAWLIVLISAATFVFTNSKQNFSFNFLFVLSQIIYCFGEEFGWRHYLQSATNGMNKWIQPFIIGTIWFSWHFSWLHEPLKAMTGQNMNVPIPVIIIGAIVVLSLVSFLFGSIINKTHSLLFPTILHFAVKTNLPTIAVTLILIILLTSTWHKFIIDKKSNE